MKIPVTRSTDNSEKSMIDTLADYIKSRGFSVHVFVYEDMSLTALRIYKDVQGERLGVQWAISQIELDYARATDVFLEEADRRMDTINKAIEEKYRKLGAAYQSIDYVIEASPAHMIEIAIKMFREGTRTLPTSVYLNAAYETSYPPITMQKMYPSKHTIRDKHDVRYECVNICFSEDVKMECVRCIREAKPQ